MKILFLSRWFPYPPDNGSKIRIFNLLKALACQHEIELISFTSNAISPEQLAILGQYCRRIQLAPYRPFQPGRLKALLGFVSTRPRSVIDTFNPDLQRLVEQVSRQDSFDMVIASQIDMAPYALGLPGSVKILEELELTGLFEEFARAGQPFRKLRSGLTWWKLSAYVHRLLSTFDGCTVVSAGELAQVRRVAPGGTSLAVIPNGVDIGHYANSFGRPAIDTLIYAGALTYGPNFDAIKFFLGEILPLIRRERPQVELRITGRAEQAQVKNLPLSPNNGVIFTGYLDDIRPAIANSWVSIVPLRIGGGTRLKILESLALGTPVIATCKGAEGLELVPGRDLLIADEPAEFAAAVLHLLQDPDLRATLSHNGRQAVEARHDWRMIGQHFNDFIEQVARGG